MELIKPWYLSRTIWASIVTVVAAAASFAGVPIDEDSGADMVELILQIVTAVSGLAAVLGRLAARSRIA